MNQQSGSKVAQTVSRAITGAQSAYRAGFEAGLDLGRQEPRDDSGPLPFIVGALCGALTVGTVVALVVLVL